MTGLHFVSLQNCKHKYGFKSRTMQIENGDLFILVQRFLKYSGLSGLFDMISGCLMSFCKKRKKPNVFVLIFQIIRFSSKFIKFPPLSTNMPSHQWFLATPPSPPLLHISCILDSYHPSHAVWRRILKISTPDQHIVQCAAGYIRCAYIFMWDITPQGSGLCCDSNYVI